MEGPDVVFSLEPDEFKAMVKSIREVKKALGEVSYDLTEKMKKKQRTISLTILGKRHKSRRNFYRRKYSLHKARLWLTVGFLYLF